MLNNTETTMAYEIRRYENCQYVDGGWTLGGPVTVLGTVDAAYPAAARASFASELARLGVESRGFAPADEAVVAVHVGGLTLNGVSGALVALVCA
jgi:hypothetical protein